MSRKLTIHKEGKAIYDIAIERDYRGLESLLSTLDVKGHRALIVTDSNIGIHYAKEVVQIIGRLASFVDVLTLPPGESQKNLNTVQLIYETLIRQQFDRKDFLFALGGGVIGDMIGYTAATYLRGISFVQLPTSLLAMVDSSIGGKTGVDFQNYKNMVGAFYQPKAVYMNLGTLATLPDREFYSGFAEIIKHGLILDKEYYVCLKEHCKEALARDYDVLEDVICRSCQIKQQVVEEDPYEAGKRALLNFGHTIGHSVEKAMNFSLLHGECVAVGIAAAAYLSFKRGQMGEKDLDEIIQVLEQYQLPTTITLPEQNLGHDLILKAIKNDKKMEAGSIKFILLRCIGEAYIDKTVMDAELLAAIEYIMGVKLL